MNANSCDNLQVMVVTMITSRRRRRRRRSRRRKRGENQETVVLPWKNARNQLEIKNEKIKAEQYHATDVRPILSSRERHFGHTSEFWPWPFGLLLNPHLQIRTSKIRNRVDACLLPHRLIKTEGQKPFFEAISTDNLPAQQFVKNIMSWMLSS